MIVKPVYLPSIEVAIEDNEGNFAFAKSSPIGVIKPQSKLQNPTLLFDLDWQ